MSASKKLPVARVSELPTGEDKAAWLVRTLWTRSGVGFLYGSAKSSKTWLGLDLAVSVASGTPCLDRFPVEDPGGVLVFLAEDPPHTVRARITALCEHRGLAVCELDLHVITQPSLRLDLPDQLEKLRATLDEFRPRLVFLDPFVRLHRKSENDAQEISGLLGDLRELQREFDVAVAIVHHVRKRSAQNPGDALRGSSDLYAWIDSGAHLAKLDDGRRRLTIEHRSAPSPDPFLLELTSRADGTCTHLRLLGEGPQQEDQPVETLAARVLLALENRIAPATTTSLRDELRVRNQRLKKTLEDLEQQNVVARVGRAGWVLTNRDMGQLTLPLC